MNVLVASDFFTTEVWTPLGLTTFYVLFFIHLGSRKVHLAGITTQPNEAFMKQIARNETMLDWGFLTGSAFKCRYFIHDRDGSFAPSFDGILEDSGIEVIKLPPRSPNLNAFAERFVRSIKEECLDRMIFFGEKSLHIAITQYLEHYHKERNHQGKDNKLLFPDSPLETIPVVPKNVVCKERLGGMLKYYHRKAG